MAQTVLTNAKILVNGHNYSGDFNQVAVAVGVDAVEDTAFGDATRTHVAGLRTGAIEGRGYFNAGSSNDLQQYTRTGMSDTPFLVAEAGAALGDACYFMKAMQAQFQIGGGLGEMLGFSVSAVASGGVPLVRGRALLSGQITATGAGTGLQMGAVSSTQKLYAVLSSTATVTGTTPTCTMIIESDDNSGFTSATTRLSFTGVTTGTPVEILAPVAGPVTDDWWRVSYTIGGTNPVYSLIVALAIL